MTTIETSKGHIMAVKVPECSRSFHLGVMGQLSYLVENETVIKDEFFDRYQIIGKCSQLTEEQAAMMVDNYGAYFNLFMNYQTNIAEFFGKGASLKSFASLMHVNGKYLVNPNGSMPLRDTSMSGLDNQDKFENWEAAEANSGEHLILFKAKK